MITKAANTILRILHAIENGLLALTLTVMILMAFTQIIMRNFASTGFVWGDAFLRYMVLWVGLMGAMVATREYNHINVDIVSFLLKGRPRSIVRMVTDAFTATVCLFLTYASIVFLKDEFAGGSKAFGSVPTWAAELILPIAFGLIGLRYTVFFIRHVHAAISGKEFKLPKQAEEEEAQ